MKSKRLLPLITVAGLSAVIAPIATLTACNGKEEPKVDVETLDIQNGVLKGFTAGLTQQQVAEAVGDTLVIPTEVTEIAKNAFSGAGTGVKLPDSVKTLTFEGNNTTKIGENAFKGTALTKIRIPASVTTIYGGAFAGCSLSNIDLSMWVNPIPDTWSNTAFDQLAGAEPTTIKIHTFTAGETTLDYLLAGAYLAYQDGVKIDAKGWFTNYNFDYEKMVVFDYDMVETDKILNNFTDDFLSIPTDIGDETTGVALQEFILGGDTLEIPADVNVIGEDAFLDDNNNSTIPTFVKSLVWEKDSVCHTIKSGAFNYADSIESITFPASLQTIESETGNGPFSSLTELNYIDVSAIGEVPTGFEVEEYGAWADSGVSAGTFVCQAGTIGDLNAGWVAYFYENSQQLDLRDWEEVNPE